MALTVTAQSLLDQVRALVDREEDDFLTDTFILTELSKAHGHVWSRLVDKFENYGVLTRNITTLAGIEVYDLPDDFLKSLMVHRLSGSDWEPVPRYTDAERHDYENSSGEGFGYQIVASGVSLLPVGAGSETVRLKYIHTATPITTAAQVITLAHPMQEDLVVLMAAKRCMIRQNLPATQFNDEIDRLEKLLETAADTRDVGRPHRIQDTYRPGGWRW